MSKTWLVIVRYGPYGSCGVVDHRTFRLQGVQALLKENGYTCLLEKISDWNQVELVVNGECVYKCNINDLQYGGDGHLDPLCGEALKAAMDAFQQQCIS